MTSLPVLVPLESPAIDQCMLHLFAVETDKDKGTASLPKFGLARLEGAIEADELAQGHPFWIRRRVADMNVGCIETLQLQPPKEALSNKGLSGS